MGIGNVAAVQRQQNFVFTVCYMFHVQYNVF